MFQMSLDTLVNHIVSANFPKHSPVLEDKALHITLDVRMSDFADGRDVTHSRKIELLFWAPNEMTYISVFSKVSAFGVNDPDWKFEGRHDSCWRDSARQVINRVYFELAERLNEGRTPHLAPKDFHTFVDFYGFGDDMFKWTPVEVTYDPADRWKHRQLVKVLNG